MNGLPGETDAATQIARLVRVDHAGEYGAKRIYQGQLAVLGRGPKGDVLRHMQAQEQHHLETFEALIAQRRVRPTALLPIWHVAGFALGRRHGTDGRTRGDGLHGCRGRGDRRALPGAVQSATGSGGGSERYHRRISG